MAPVAPILARPPKAGFSIKKYYGTASNINKMAFSLDAKAGEILSS